MENRKVYIYKITNPKGKIYIGSTVNIKDREYRYKTARIKNQVKIYNSILKYGFDNHKFEIIFECDESNRNIYESFYGEKFDVIGDNGLNLSLPASSESYPSMSSETKAKIGLAHKGKKISEAQKISISNNSKKYLKNNPHPMLNKTPWNKGKSFLKGELNPMYGVKRSLEWKISHSKLTKSIAKKGSDHFRSKIVLDTCLGIFYYSCKEVSDCYNIKYSTLKGKLNGTSKNNTNFKYV